MRYLNLCKFVSLLLRHWVDFCPVQRSAPLPRDGEPNRDFLTLTVSNDEGPLSADFSQNALGPAALPHAPSRFLEGKGQEKKERREGGGSQGLRQVSKEIDTCALD